MNKDEIRKKAEEIGIHAHSGELWEPEDIADSIMEFVLSVQSAQREEDSKLCLKIWREAKNTRESGFKQNTISHGCIACSEAIRAQGE